MSHYEIERATALKAVIEAAAVCRRVQAGISPETLEKKDKSPVTVADFASQALVCRLLHNAFSSDPVIGEEDAAELRLAENRPLLERLLTHVRHFIPDAGESEVLSWIDRGGHSDYESRFWTLDPIDGTKGFLRKEQYAVSLALVVEGDIVVAALCCPNLRSSTSGDIGAAFIAVKGEGAFEVDMNTFKETAIRVSPQVDQRLIRTCESVEKAHSSHDDAARIKAHLGIVAEPARLDSQAKYAVVARGDAEAYLRLPKSAEYREKIWDHAGGVLVVEEAGGRVTDIFGKPLDFSRGRTLEENRGVIVSSGLHHDAIINAVSALCIGQF